LGSHRLALSLVSMRFLAAFFAVLQRKSYRSQHVTCTSQNEHGTIAVQSVPIKNRYGMYILCTALHKCFVFAPLISGLQDTLPETGETPSSPIGLIPEDCFPSVSPEKKKPFKNPVFPFHRWNGRIPWDSRQVSRHTIPYNR